MWRNMKRSFSSDLRLASLLTAVFQICLLIDCSTGVRFVGAASAHLSVGLSQWRASGRRCQGHMLRRDWARNWGNLFQSTTVCNDHVGDCKWPTRWQTRPSSVRHKASDVKTLIQQTSGILLCLVIGREYASDTREGCIPPPKYD